jgi:hypothetical protein
MKQKPKLARVPPQPARPTDVVKEEIAKAAQTAQLLRADLGSAYKAADDSLLQIILLRLMKLATELHSEVAQVEVAIGERK